MLTSLTGQTGSRRQRLCLYFRSKYPFCCYSVAQSCPILCDPTDWSMPGFPDLHCLPECAQTMFTESLIQSNYLNVCCSLLLLPSIFPSIRVFSNESALHIRWPKYCNFSFSISPSNEYAMHPWCLDIGFSVLEWMNEQTVGSGAREVSQHVKGIRKDR